MSFIEKFSTKLKLRPYEITLLRQLKEVIPVLLVMYVYHWVSDHYGFENAIISLMVILIFTLRDISNGVKANVLSKI